jgi:two-component system sensor histidine kinase/response regulator
MSIPITDTTATDCLLVVDDQEANIQVLGAMLGKLGFEILPATSAEQAWKRLSVRRPDLILMDLIMPGMDGFQLCQRIQNHPEWMDIPIIFLSAADDKNLIVRALESGGVDYITKPFNKLELISRVRTHLMLKSTRDHLKRLAQDKEELLSMISHHLQNHLAGMNMSAQMLLDRAEKISDAKLNLMAENIRSSSSQMRSFVKSFLANAAADRGFQLTLESTSLADAASRASAQFEEVAKAKGITLRRNLVGDAPPIRADVPALVQILDNLISNAIKFSPTGKEVFITVRASGKFVECEVRDQGPGFTEEDKLRMFHRYARLSARPTGGEPSTGLGLSIVKKLIHGMGGELVCESEPGNGAAFTLRVPVAKP